MFLTPRQLKTLTGVSGDDPEGQVRVLDEKRVRHFGINRAGRVIVPCSAIEGSKPTEPPAWSPDFSKMGV